MVLESLVCILLPLCFVVITEFYTTFESKTYLYNILFSFFSKLTRHCKCFFSFKCQDIFHFSRQQVLLHNRFDKLPSILVRLSDDVNIKRKYL